MFGLFYIIIANFTSTVHTIEKGVSVTVFFDKGLSEDEIQNIGDEISKRVEVGKIDLLMKHGRIFRGSISREERVWRRDLPVTTRLQTVRTIRFT